MSPVLRDHANTPTPAGGTRLASAARRATTRPPCRPYKDPCWPRNAPERGCRYRRAVVPRDRADHWGEADYTAAGHQALIVRRGQGDERPLAFLLERIRAGVGHDDDLYLHIRYWQ